MITGDFFYQEIGKDRKERQLNYQKLFIDEIIEKNYSKKIWGSDKQRYIEKRKIKRRLVV